MGPRTRGARHLLAVHDHCHAPTCLKMEMWNNDTGKLLCRQQILCTPLPAPDAFALRSLTRLGGARQTAAATRSPRRAATSRALAVSPTLTLTLSLTLTLTLTLALAVAPGALRRARLHRGAALPVGLARARA